MGSYEDNDNNHTWALKRQSEEPELGFKWSCSHTGISKSTLDVTEEAFVQKFENVGIKSNENDTTCDERKDFGGLNGSCLHPLRPYAEDCLYYLRTGTCKFGPNCKFNHPVKRANQSGKEEDKAKDDEGFSEKSGQIECKYYLTAGGCKYGISCRFSHSKPESEIVLPELNFLGLPIRVGEKECSFYMRNGSCGYGGNCRFHHPDPTTVGGSDYHKSTVTDESVVQFGRSSENCSREFIPLHLSSQPAQASWSSPMIPTIPFLDNRSSYMPSTNLLPQRVPQNPEWSGYQVPGYLQEMTRHHHSGLAANSFMKKAEVTMQVEEFPERPGLPECDYFMKTGDCKYKSVCRYHHPKNPASKADVCVLSDKGLPLRPGRKICWHYESFGICKYGRACLFDHPVNHDSQTSPDGSVLESPSGGTDWPSWE